jgi:hypothetical protein
MKRITVCFFEFMLSSYRAASPHQAQKRQRHRNKGIARDATRYSSLRLCEKQLAALTVRDQPPNKNANSVQRVHPSIAIGSISISIVQTSLKSLSQKINDRPTRAAAFAIDLKSLSSRLTAPGISPGICVPCRAPSEPTPASQILV